MSRTHFTSLLFFSLAVGGCSDPTAVERRTNTPGPSDVLVFAPLTPIRMVATAGANAPSLPKVRVYRGNIGPVAGTTVTFTLVTPSGESYEISTKTGSDGIATLASWQVGTELGKYRATAQVAGARAIDFLAYVRGDITGIYDLVGIEGGSFPSNYATEGHYVLFAGGFYVHIYNGPVDEGTLSSPGAIYERESSGEIVFYVDPAPSSAFYSANSDVFARGTPAAGRMVVKYTNNLNYDNETYQAR